MLRINGRTIQETALCLELYMDSLDIPEHNRKFLKDSLEFIYRLVEDEFPQEVVDQESISKEDRSLQLHSEMGQEGL